MFERRYSALIIASVVTVASFVAATAYTQNRLARLDALSSTMERNAVPSIEYLSRTAVRLTRLNRLLDETAARSAQRTAAIAAARSEANAIDDEVTRYLRLPPLAGEQSLWTALRGDVDRALVLTRGTLDDFERGVSPSNDSAARMAVGDALDEAARSVLATLDFDVRQSESMARDVRNVRATTLRMIIQLDAVATVIAFFAVIVAYRASRRHDQLVREHSSVLADRVAELDRFAGRVAHDVLSPLETVTMGLALLDRTADAQGHTYVERSQRAVQRVRQLVEGLLLFARSGARPDLTSTCSVGAVVRSVIADCSLTAAEEHIEIVSDISGTMQVRCTVGVLTSIIQNLVRNAVKYMGAQPVRRIVVRARRAGDVVRLEVEDTGPGIALELQPSIFEPFVRGPAHNVTGTGLGLATVKRLVEGHAGAVGLRSKPGSGSLFWVELPLAPEDAADQISADHQKRTPVSARR